MRYHEETIGGTEDEGRSTRVVRVGRLTEVSGEVGLLIHPSESDRKIRQTSNWVECLVSVVSHREWLLV